MTDRKLNIVNILSQSHSSATYAVAVLLLGFWFGGIFLTIVLLGLFFGAIERFVWNKRTPPPPGTLAVIITGCSSGFGSCLTKRLAAQGILVFAGVRKESDGEKLKQSSESPENIIPIIADVTKKKELKKAAEVIKTNLEESGRKLLALVNNAGFGYYAPIEAANIEKVRDMYDVNVFGLINATQVFTPLLRQYGSTSPLRARVVNISSGAGKAAMPPSGLYCSTKFAVEAISDSLRMELKPWNIPVVIVEPGRFHTKFENKAYVDLEVEGIGELTEEQKQHYVSVARKVNEESAKKNRPSRVKCVEIIEDSLFDTKPLARYLAGLDVQLGIPLISVIGHSFFTDYILGKKWAKLSQ